MLRILNEKKKTEYYNSMLNKNVTVLFEEENHNGVMFGWTSNYVRVKQEFNKNLINKLSQNKICGIEDNICISTSI